MKHRRREATSESNKDVREFTELEDFPWHEDRWSFTDPGTGEDGEVSPVCLWERRLQGAPDTEAQCECSPNICFAWSMVALLRLCMLMQKHCHVHIGLSGKLQFRIEHGLEDTTSYLRRETNGSAGGGRAY